jgi:hypothetical protein
MLEALGNIGDFLGGVGVFATLSYLAVQIRNNTTSTRSASYQAAVSSVSDLSRAIGLARDVARLFSAGQIDRGMTPSETARD